MKKISFFISTLEGGGAERNVINIINNLNRDKYIIDLVLGKARGVFMDQIPTDVSVFNLNTSYGFILFFKLIGYFRKEKPDIFISSFPHINIISLVARKVSLVKTKVVITEHGIVSLLSTTARSFTRRLVARFILPLAIKMVYPSANAIICVSKGVAEDLSKMIKSQMDVIYNPIVSDDLYKLAEEEYSFGNIPTIIMVGRLTKVKDYPNLLKAFNLVLKQKEARLVILGEGPEEGNIERLTKELGLSEKVILLGFQKNPYKYMKGASVFVLSSFHEGFGNVIVEAMACGTPVISTNCSGPSEIIENGKSGLLVPVGDSKALAEAIIKVLNNDHNFSEEGKKRAQSFSIKESVKQYEEVFDRL